MNICFLCQNFHYDRGGTETYTLAIANALAREGHVVHIIAENKGAFNRSGLGEAIIIHTIDFEQHPFTGYWKIDKFIPLSDLRYSMAVAKKVYEIVKEHKIDIVESTDYFRQGFWYALNKKTPFFLRLHGWFFNRDDGRRNPVGTLNFRERLLWRMQESSITHADGLSAVATDFANFVKEIWNCQNRDISIIPNGVDASLFCPKEGEGRRERSVLFAARLVKNKGVMILAQAIPKVLEEFPDIKFCFAGKDMLLRDEGITAQEYILQQVPHQNVRFLGEISRQELIDFYQKSLIYVCPSFYEAFSIAGLEAMGCGCAVVATNVGGFKDMIRHGDDGLLVPAGDPDKLADAIKKYLRDDGLREKCSKNAVTKISKNFNHTQLVKKTICAYQQAIKRFNEKKGQLCQKSA